jgi:hypothetical protein
MRAQLDRNATLLLCLLISLSCSVAFSSVRVAAADDQTIGRVDAERIQQIVDDLKERLSIPQPVTVSIVDRNPLMASVGPVTGGGFALSFEADFARQLTDEELTAAVAHELGHVWIYTHFPFLQTEQLANEIAMRVVSRESLEPLYTQMLNRTRINLNLSEYLGDPQSSR